MELQALLVQREQMARMELTSLGATGPAGADGTNELTEPQALLVQREQMALTVDGATGAAGPAGQMAPE